MRAGRHALQIVEFLSVEEIGRIAVTGFRCDRELAEYLVGNRPGEGRITFHGSVVANDRAHRALEIFGRRAGRDIDRAGHGIATEQMPLGSTQHFDLFNIEQGLVDGLRLTEINAVQIHTDPRVKADIATAAANTAHRDLRSTW